ncbi:tail fiber assembly protein [Dickeya solani]|uniref:Tail fiber assembly protein n=1 Tax=Dickeya solani TaxID=1089444 RepID=A0AAX4F689_9GAMM|nr:tail fiber assembly protein [Dickeya solani]WOA54885.1 tail fiber assembly protein [Dickeya solani]
MVVSTQETRAVLAADGLASEAGWLRVYHADTVTCEYYGSSEEYLMLGTGIPAHSYADEPPQPVAERQALRRSSDGLRWEQVPDLRGQTAYDTQMLRPQVVSELGPLPASLTLLLPASEFDRWDGVQWVTDTAARQVSLLQSTRQELDTQRQVAHDRIRELTYAQELDIATGQENQALKDWKTYLVWLSRIDPTHAPDIDWPSIPTN